MKFRQILSILAGVSLLAACTEESPVQTREMSVDITPSYMSLPREAGATEIKVKASGAWTATIAQTGDWLTLSALSGNGDATLDVNFAANTDSKSRTAVITVKGANGDSKLASLVQESGEIEHGLTEDDPMSVAQAVALCKKLDDKAEAPKKYYVTGIISSINEEFGTQYGNATFDISDDGAATGAQFTCYRILYFDNVKYSDPSQQNISKGDKVMIYGTLMNYGGTPETSQNKAYLVSLEKNTKPTLSTKNAEVTVAASETKASFDITAANLTGAWTVSSDAAWLTSFTQTGTESGTIEVEFPANEVAEDREAVLTVKADGAADLVLTLKQLAYQANGTAEKPYTVAEALEVINALADGGKTPTEVYVKGIIANVSEVSLSYKNAGYTISDNGSNEETITVFRGKYIDGADFTAEDQIQAGDIVVVKGVLQKYVKNEVVTPQVSTGSSIVTLTRPISVAKALEIIDALEDGKTTDETYVVKGIVVGANGIDTKYGNATFKVGDASDDASLLTVFRAKSFDNEAFTETDVFSEYDVVYVTGNLQKYVKNGAVTPELTKGYLVAVQPAK